MNNPFFDFAREGCMQAAADLEEVECLYIGPSEHTRRTRIQVVEDLITRRVDGIAVSHRTRPRWRGRSRGQTKSAFP